MVAKWRKGENHENEPSSVLRLFSIKIDLDAFYWKFDCSSLEAPNKVMWIL